MLFAHAELSDKLKVKSSSEDSFFTAEVSIGTPEQRFPLIIDTGSADLYVSPNCRVRMWRRGHWLLTWM